MAGLRELDLDGGERVGTKRTDRGQDDGDTPAEDEDGFREQVKKYREGDT
jgi:hypothetical protein